MTFPIRKFLLCLLLTGSLTSFAQVFSSFNINLLSLVTPNTYSTSGNKYSGCWGWYQQSKNREYAISGASHGTYFVDITNPLTPTVCAFLPGSSNCTWREMKTYRNYCYIVSDVCKPNQFQIVDLQYLPDSIHVVHNSDTLVELGHTVWVDTAVARLYIGSTTFKTGHSPLTIFSLATPSLPVLLKRIEEDIPSNVIPEVHDMFARNDTIYVSAAWYGIQVLRYDAQNDTLIQLGEYKGFAKAGYNHSSYLTENGKTLVFCEEVPSSLPIHIVDVQNLGNIQPIVAFHPHPYTTPHNPFVIGNDWAIVSCYKDGLEIYNISQPDKVNMTGFFDTHPQGGFNTGDYGGGAYSGNWGAYPFLPSKVIIANDMQNGIFILDATPAYTTTLVNPVNQVGLSEHRTGNGDFAFFPNPAKDKIHILNSIPGLTELSISNTLGQLIFKKEAASFHGESIDIGMLKPGTYMISLQGNGITINRKLVIAR